MKITLHIWELLALQDYYCQCKHDEDELGALKLDYHNCDRESW